MLEPRRQSFLDAMGVVSYVPRFVLPNALPSPRCEMPLPGRGKLRPEPQPEVSAVAAPATNTPSQNLAAPTRVVPGQSGEARRRGDMPAVETAPAQPKPAQATAAEAVRFNADLVTSLLGLMFVSDGNLIPEQKRLLANIASAFSRHCLQGQEAGLQAGRFSWPVVQTAGLAQGAEAARDALTANLLAQAERQGVKWVVVFGERLLAYVDAELLAREGVSLLRAASLAELPGNAGAKAALWRALQEAARGGAETA